MFLRQHHPGASITSNERDLRKDPRAPAHLLGIRDVAWNFPEIGASLYIPQLERLGHPPRAT